MKKISTNRFSVKLFYLRSGTHLNTPEAIFVFGRDYNDSLFAVTKINF